MFGLYAYAARFICPKFCLPKSNLKHLSDMFFLSRCRAQNCAVQDGINSAVISNYLPFSARAVYISDKRALSSLFEELNGINFIPSAFFTAI